MIRKSSINKSNKGIAITFVESVEEIENISNELRINFQIYNDKEKSKYENNEKVRPGSSKSPIKENDSSKNHKVDNTENRSKSPVRDPNVSPRNREPVNYYSINTNG